MIFWKSAAFVAALQAALLMDGFSAEPLSPVSFSREIAPILQRRCAACHGEDSAKGGYRLDSFSKMWKAGDSDLAPLVAGKPGDSELHQLLLEKGADDRMPQKADPLPAKEIALIERWIREGANNDGGDRSLAELVRDSLLLPAPQKYSRPAPVTALAFSLDGKLLAASGYYEITLWDVESGALVRRIGGLPERIASIAWRKNLLAVGGGSPSQWGGVFLIGADFKPRLVADLPDTALSVSLSADGKLLAACGGDRTIRLFDTTTGKVTRLLKQHSDFIQSVAFSHDGRRLLSASRDRTARVFSVEDGEVLAAYDDHEAPVMMAGFSYHGAAAYSIARGRPVHSWNASNGKQSAQFAEAGRGVQVLLDTRLGLITGSTDGTVRLSDASDQRTLMTFFGHRDCVESLALSPNGQRFASGAHDGEVCIWELKCESWVGHFFTSP